MDGMRKYVARCGTGACAEVTEVEGGVILTSTLGADRGRLALDSAEFGQFVTDVKAGRLDHMVTVVPALA